MSSLASVGVGVVLTSLLGLSAGAPHTHSPQAAKHSHSPQKVPHPMETEPTPTNCEKALCRDPGAETQTGSESLCNGYKAEGHGCFWESTTTSGQPGCRAEPCHSEISIACASQVGWDVSSCHEGEQAERRRAAHDAMREL